MSNRTGQLLPGVHVTLVILRSHHMPSGYDVLLLHCPTPNAAHTSVDIIKSAGYKLSALMIESAIMEHPGVAEVAVLGVPDDVYGEVVTAIVARK